MTHNFDFNEQSKNNPFYVPDGYFENFALEIDSRITPVRVPFMNKISTYMYAAAMFVIIFTVSLIFFGTNNMPKNLNQTAVTTGYNQKTNELLLDDLNEDEITEYILVDGY
jgi:hypothetical protein